MRIRIIAPDGVKHAGKTYEADEEFDASDALAGYFIGVGWAEPADEGDVERLREDNLLAERPANHHHLRPENVRVNTTADEA